MLIKVLNIDTKTIRSFRFEYLNWTSSIKTLIGVKIEQRFSLKKWNTKKLTWLVKWSALETIEQFWKPN